MIIQLSEEHRMLEERIKDHFKECGLTMDNVCTTLPNAQTKLKGNAILWRQVKNLKRRTGLLGKHLEY
jgi:hypothetical protein